MYRVLDSSDGVAVFGGKDAAMIGPAWTAGSLMSLSPRMVNMLYSTVIRPVQDRSIRAIGISSMTSQVLY
jgi:hypothetical protein